MKLKSWVLAGILTVPSVNAFAHYKNRVEPTVMVRVSEYVRKAPRVGKDGFERKERLSFELSGWHSWFFSGRLKEVNDYDPMLWGLKPGTVEHWKEKNGNFFIFLSKDGKSALFVGIYDVDDETFKGVVSLLGWNVETKEAEVLKLLGYSRVRWFLDETFLGISLGKGKHPVGLEVINNEEGIRVIIKDGTKRKIWKINGDASD